MRMRLPALAVYLLIGYAVSALAEEVETVSSGGVMLLDAKFSRDGAHLIVGGGKGFSVYSTRTGDVVQQSTDHIVREIACSPADPSLFATWSDDYNLRLYKIGTEKPVWVTPSNQGFGQRLVFFPDGKLLAASCFMIREQDGKQLMNSYLQLVDVSSGQERERIDQEHENNHALAVSSDGEWLAVGKVYSRELSAVVIYSRQNLKVAHTLPIRDGFPNSVEFLNQRGDVLIVGGKYFGPDAEPERDARIWRASLDPAGEYIMKRLVQENIDSYRHAVTTPNGERVVVCTSEGRSFFKLPALRPGQVVPPKPQLDRWKLTPVIQLRDTTTGKLIWTIDGSLAGEVAALDISPDGQHVAYCLDSSVFIVSTAAGEVEHKIIP